MKTFISNFRYLLIFPCLLFMFGCSDPDEEAMHDLNNEINLEAEFKKANNAAIAKEYTVDLGSLNDSCV